MIGRLALFFLAGFFQGCAPQHYTTIQANTVNLYLQAPQATNVQFASSEDRYTLREATKNQDGTWMINGLANREFQYFYLVDGKLLLPDCRFRQSDDFGTTNCRYLP
jgi:hypothetical protein